MTISKQQLYKLLDEIPEKDADRVKIFLESIIKKRKESQNKSVSLQGLFHNSSVTDEDLEKAKKIWK